MSELRKQSRLASFVEAIANTVIGFCISVTGQWFMFMWLGIKATGGQFLLLSLAMTVLSVVRGYTLRRMWNAEWWKRFKRNHPTKYGPEMPPFCIGCQCVFDVASQKVVRHGCKCGNHP